MIRISIILCVSLIFQLGFSQVNELKTHVYTLSDDSLEGRLTGTKGEQMASRYISNQFMKYGISAINENGFLQAFDFTLGKELGNNNSCTVNGQDLILEEDYFPMEYSGSGNVSGYYYDISTKEDLSIVFKKEHPVLANIEIFLEEPAHPHAEIDYRQAIEKLINMGASGIVFYNANKMLPNPTFDLSNNITPYNIPIVFMNDFPEANDKTVLELSVHLKKKSGTGHNVIAKIDNNTKNTVVVGAHYDHLGYGEYGGSLYRGEPAIHNGADDNASGVALIIELAKKLRDSNLKNNNYIFIAFSGEELGLFGSKYFANNPLIDMQNVNYMFNFDMVGRLDIVERDLAVNGVGTSPVFEEIVKATIEGNLITKTTASGVGPSDHTSFYLKDLPVLHFFTGTTPDYHKPSDDAHLINYEGLQDVLNYSYAIVEELDDKGKLVFTKTKDEDARKAPKFSVTLGVVPDYMFDGAGMRIEGVTDGKPASKANILAGDIVIKMGGIEVKDMMSYMTALSKFKKGDSVPVKVIRNGKEEIFNVTF